MVSKFCTLQVATRFEFLVSEMLIYWRNHLSKILIIGILLNTPGVLAQNYVELVKLYYSNSAINYFEHSDSSTRIEEMGADVNLPIVINASDVFLTGFIFEKTQVRLFDSDPNETISMLGLRVGLSKKHSDKWTGTYLVIPKLSSDFERITRKDFQVGMIVLMKYTKQENLHYKFGAYYGSEFFGPMFVPLFGLYYLSSNKKFEVNLTLPFIVDANYKLHNRLDLGVNFFGQVRSYHLSQIPETSNEGYVVKASNDLFSYLKFNLTKGLSFQAKIGYSIGRSYRVYDDSDQITFGSVLVKVGDDRQQLNTDFSNGMTYQVALLYRFIKE